MKPFQWVKVQFFGAWLWAWCNKVDANGVWAQVADDAPFRFFPFARVNAQ